MSDEQKWANAEKGKSSENGIETAAHFFSLDCANVNDEIMLTPDARSAWLLQQAIGWRIKEIFQDGPRFKLAEAGCQAF